MSETDQLGPYELKDVIADTSVIRAWKAERHGNTYDLVTFKPGAEVSYSRASEFQQTLAAFKALATPYVVDVIDIIRSSDGQWYAPKECFDGQPLSDLQVGGKLSQLRMCVSAMHVVAQAFTELDTDGMPLGWVTPDDVLILTSEAGIDCKLDLIGRRGFPAAGMEPDTQSATVTLGRILRGMLSSSGASGERDLLLEQLDSTLAAATDPSVLEKWVSGIRGESQNITSGRGEIGVLDTLVGSDSDFLPVAGTVDDLASDGLLGQTLDGRYRIDAELGRGGQGVVLRGQHLVLDRPVAIKVLLSSKNPDESDKERFIREGRALTRINHPNVVQIYDSGQLPDGAFYLVMEFVEGPDLSSYLEKRQRLSSAETIPISLDVASGLAAAHAVNVTHRDLKPGNILLDTAGTKITGKVTDFGIARMADATTLTEAGRVVGTVQYMSPEQISGAKVDGQTDVYSLGILMYELLAGRAPFVGDMRTVLVQHHMSSPPPIKSFAPDTDASDELIGLVESMLAKEPTARPPGMAAVVASLRRL